MHHFWCIYLRQALRLTCLSVYSLSITRKTRLITLTRLTAITRLTALPVLPHREEVALQRLKGENVLHC
jgi:hypothetical protein